MRILVINPNTSEEMTSDIGEAARRYARAGTEIESIREFARHGAEPLGQLLGRVPRDKACCARARSARPAQGIGPGVENLRWSAHASCRIRVRLALGYAAWR